MRRSWWAVTRQLRWYGLPTRIHDSLRHAVGAPATPRPGAPFSSCGRDRRVCLRCSDTLRGRKKRYLSENFPSRAESGPPQSWHVMFRTFTGSDPTRVT